MPYWRLSGFYFFYFAALGVLVPYWGLYLQSLGYSALAIGQLLAIPMATKIIAPNVWGWLGDHLGQRMQIVRLASFISMLIFTLIFIVDGFWWFALAMVLFSFFWNASLPQFEVVTLTYLGQQTHLYSRIRLWGSVGFIVAVVLVGQMIDLTGLAIVPFALFFVYIAIWSSSLLVSDVETEIHSDNGYSFVSVIRQPAVLAFLSAAFLMQFGHGVYYAFYSIYLDGYGYSKVVIGELWAVGVIAEIIAFLFMHRLMQRYPAGRVLMASLVFAALRWLLIALFPGSLLILFLAQALHAATFGTFHAASIHLVHRYFTGRHEGRGQALYSSLSFGAGGAAGSLLTGILWDSSGPMSAFSVSIAVSLLAAFILWRWHDENYA